MSTKTHRSGGKIAGNHTTVIGLAGEVVDILEACTLVSKISLGFIGSKMGRTNDRRAKLSMDGSCILVAVRDTMSGQDVRVYPKSDLRQTMLAIARALRDADIKICFEKK